MEASLHSVFHSSGELVLILKTDPKKALSASAFSSHLVTVSTKDNYCLGMIPKHFVPTLIQFCLDVFRLFIMMSS